MTLLETLLVVVLLGAMSMVAMGVIGRGGQDDRAAEAVLRSTLERTHLIARSRGGAELTGGPRLQIAPVRVDGLGARQQTLPAGWRLEIKRGDDVLESLAFTSEGFAPDAVLSLRTDDGGHIVFAYSGISGELDQIPPEDQR